MRWKIQTGPSKLHNKSITRHSWYTFFFVHRSEQSLGILASQQDSSEPDLDFEASVAAAQLHKLTREKYCIGMAIASGCFAAVKQCSDKEEGKSYLLRAIHKAKAFGQDDKLLQEVEIMRKIRHENVLTVQDYWESSSEICMVMEPIEVSENIHICAIEPVDKGTPKQSIFQELVLRHHINPTM